MRYANIRTIKSNRERLLTLLFIGGEIAVNDIEVYITPKYVPNLLYRLQSEGLIKRHKYGRVRTVYLTDAGINFVYKKYGLYSTDSAVENLFDRTVGKEECIRTQRRARSFVAFASAGIDIEKKYERMRTPFKESFYIDSLVYKPNLGKEIKGSRATGLFVTKHEVYTVYSSEGMFNYIQTIEDRAKRRINNQLMSNNKVEKKEGEIILCTSINELGEFLNTDRAVERTTKYLDNNQKLKTKSYEIAGNDKYFIPLCCAETLIRLHEDIITRDEKLNEIFSQKLNKGVNVSNKELNTYISSKTNSKEYIVSIIDLNLLTLKRINDAVRKHKKNVTVIGDEKFQKFFEDFWGSEYVRYIPFKTEVLLEMVN